MISIVIPTFNEQKFLPSLLESIQAQGVKELEIIVSDNNSSDETREIAQRYGAKLIGGGVPSVARNRGAIEAKGEYILFLDADVTLPKDFLKELIERFEQDYIDICIPALHPSDARDKVYTTVFAIANTYFKLMEKIKPQGGGACILVTKRLHRRIGGFDETRRRSEDLDYIHRAAGVGRFKCYSDFHVYCSVRRFETEGIATILQKYFRAAVIFFFTGRADDKVEYKYGNFSRAVLSTAKSRRNRSDRIIVRKLLSSFNRLTKTLKKQLKELGIDRSIFRMKDS